MDDFEGSSGLDDGYDTPDDVVRRDHPVVDLYELKWDHGGAKSIVGWGEQAYCLSDEFLEEFANMFDESLE